MFLAFDTDGRGTLRLIRKSAAFSFEMYLAQGMKAFVLEQLP